MYFGARYVTLVVTEERGLTMSDKDRMPEHYQISVFADMVGLPQSKVRFYERSGLLPVRKKENGYRYFLPEDAFRMNEFRVLRSYGFSVEDAIRLLEEEQSSSAFTQSLVTQRETLLAEQKRLQSRMENIDRTLRLIEAGEALLNPDDTLPENLKQGERFFVVDEPDVLYVRASHGRDFSVSTRNAQALAEFVHMLPDARYLRIVRRECFETDTQQVDPDYIVGIPITERSKLKDSPASQLELLKLGRCLCHIRCESRKTSVEKQTFDPVFTYMEEHGYHLRGDILIKPTFLNLDGEGTDVELLYVPII